MAIERYTNNGTSTLNGAINNSTTSVVVTSAASFPSTGLFSVIVDSEIMTVTAVSSNTFTVTRGAEGTTAVSHLDLAPIDEVETARSIDQFFLDQISVGTFSSLPTENKAGRLYLPTDGWGSEYNNGSSYSPYWPGSNVLLTPIVNGSFSWLNQNSSTNTAQGSGYTLKVPTQVGVNITGRYKTLALSSGYTATMCFSLNTQLRGSTTSSGLMLYDSGSGKVITYGIRNDGTAGITTMRYEYNSSTSFNTAGGELYIYPSNPIWLRAVDDTTNRRFSVSTDGLTFFETFVEGRTAFATPDSIGYYIDPSGNAGNSYLTVLSFLEA